MNNYLKWTELFNRTNHLQWKSKEYIHGKDNHIHTTEYSVVEDAQHQCIRIDFQCTDSESDWKANFEFPKVYYRNIKTNFGNITLKAHGGWAAMYKSVKDNVIGMVQNYLKMNPDFDIIIVGFSLGSALAQLCAQDVYYHTGKKVYLYTFGSVNPFACNLLEKRRIIKYLRSCCQEVYNFSNLTDVVSYVPFCLWGYHKIRRVTVGRFRWLKRLLVLPVIVGLFFPHYYHAHYENEKWYKGIK